jgi:N-glycosylase/DNA lyase
MDYKEARELAHRYLVLQDLISKANQDYWNVANRAPDKRVISSEDEYKQFLTDKDAYKLLLDQKQEILREIQQEEKAVESNLKGFFVRSGHAHVQIQVVVDGDTYNLGCYAGTKEIYYNIVNE